MSFVVAILPVILIGIYVYKKDKIKESSNLLAKLFVGGISSCFPAAIVGLILGSFFPEVGNMNFIQLFIYVFVVVAFVEEVCKWIFLYNIAYKNPEYDSSYDMLVYACFAALGFACFENILYVLESGFMTALLRAFTAVPGHVCDGILMGSYLTLAKHNDLLGNQKLAKKYKRLSIVVPAVVHGIYDFCLFAESLTFLLIFIVFVITMYVVCIKKIKYFSNNNKKFFHKNNYCTKCGTPANSNYCVVCGNKNN